MPLEHNPTPSLEGALNDVHAPLLERFSANFALSVQDHLMEVWGRRFYLDAQGTLVPQAGPAPQDEFDLFEFYSQAEFPPASMLWQEVYLTPEHAKRLQVDFNRLVERLERRDGNRARAKNAIWSRWVSRPLNRENLPRRICLRRRAFHLSS